MPRNLSSGANASPASALVRAELCFVVVSVALLASVALASITTTKSSSERSGCRNNLRRLGQAFSEWAQDHDGRFPWTVGYREGGVAESYLVDKAWMCMLPLSNYVSSPRVLVCPSDASKTVATNWENCCGPYAFAYLQNAGLSYFIGYDTPAEEPHAVLSGDRNIRPAGGSFCSRVKVGAWEVDPVEAWFFQWNNGPHGTFGNVLFADGRTDQSGRTSNPLARIPNRFHVQLPQ